MSESFPQERFLDREDLSNSSSIFGSNLEKSNETYDPLLVLVPRQDEDEEDEEQRKNVIQGVGNILTGAFALDLKKVLKGAFSFADKDVQVRFLYSSQKYTANNSLIHKCFIIFGTFYVG